MGEHKSRSDDLDEHSLQLLDSFDVEPESLPEILVDILLGSQLLNELPECPDVMEELMITFAFWKFANKKFEFKKFIIAWRIAVRMRVPEKVELFDAFADALNRIYDKWDDHRLLHKRSELTSWLYGLIPHMRILNSFSIGSSR